MMTGWKTVLLLAALAGCAGVQATGQRDASANVQVRGNEVRFETDRLLFVGQMSGSNLSGTVTHKDQEEQARIKYDPGSEWTPEVIP